MTVRRPLIVGHPERIDIVAALPVGAPTRPPPRPHRRLDRPCQPLRMFRSHVDLLAALQRDRHRLASPDRPGCSTGPPLDPPAAELDERAVGQAAYGLDLGEMDVLADEVDRPEGDEDVIVQHLDVQAREHGIHRQEEQEYEPENGHYRSDFGRELPVCGGARPEYGRAGPDDRYQKSAPHERHHPQRRPRLFAIVRAVVTHSVPAVRHLSLRPGPRVRAAPGRAPSPGATRYPR